MGTSHSIRNWKLSHVNTDLLALGDDPECLVLLFTEPMLAWLLASTELTLLAFRGDITDPCALFEAVRRGWVVDRLWLFASSCLMGKTCRFVTKAVQRSMFEINIRTKEFTSFFCQTKRKMFQIRTKKSDIQRKTKKGIQFTAEVNTSNFFLLLLIHISATFSYIIARQISHYSPSIWWSLLQSCRL